MGVTLLIPIPTTKLASPRPVPAQLEVLGVEVGEDSWRSGVESTSFFFLIPLSTSNKNAVFFFIYLLLFVYIAGQWGGSLLHAWRLALLYHFDFRLMIAWDGIRIQRIVNAMFSTLDG